MAEFAEKGCMWQAIWRSHRACCELLMWRNVRAGSQLSWGSACDCNQTNLLGRFAQDESSGSDWLPCLCQANYLSGLCGSEVPAGGRAVPAGRSPVHASSSAKAAPAMRSAVPASSRASAGAPNSSCAAIPARCSAVAAASFSASAEPAVCSAITSAVPALRRAKIPKPEAPAQGVIWRLCQQRLPSTCLAHAVNYINKHCCAEGPTIFKIGATSDPHCRYHNRAIGYEHDADEYKVMAVIMEFCTSEAALYVESALIAQFYGKPGCRNEAKGGEGISCTKIVKHYVYVVYRNLPVAMTTLDLAATSDV